MQQESLLSSTLTTINKARLQSSFSDFISFGSFPEYLETKQEAYLHSLYESIIYRDIVARYKVNEKTLKLLVLYLASHVGKELSYNALRKMLGLASATTVSDYCGYIENSYLGFLVSRYSYSLKKQVHYAKKIYFIDQALAKTVGFRISDDYGRLLENIVFLELKQRGKEIYFHKEKKECDFVIKEKTQIVNAIQVSAILADEKTKLREIEGLLEVLKTYHLTTGYILTENESRTETITQNQRKYTIHIIPIWFWLLEIDKK